MSASETVLQVSSQRLQQMAQSRNGWYFDALGRVPGSTIATGAWSWCVAPMVLTHTRLPTLHLIFGREWRGLYHLELKIFI